MRISSAVLRGASVATLLLLSGCVSPPQVKQVLGDKEGYLSKNFDPATLPEGVRREVASKDGGSIPYVRMVVDMSWTLNSDDKEKQVKYQDKVTYINAGGPFLEELHEASRNGVPTTQRFTTSYRGILALKSEALNVGNTMAGMTFVAHDFKQFEPLRPDASKSIEFAYTSGTTVQLMNFREGRNSCILGDSYAASRANASLEGDAQDIECTNYNANGVVSGKSHYVYLKKYGTAVFVKGEGSGGTSEGHIDAVKFG